MSIDDGAAVRGLRVALVGAGQQGEALLRILTGVPTIRVVVVAHADPESPALLPARLQGIPIISTYRDVFAHGPDIVVDASAASDVFEELERSKPAHVEVIGARSVTLLQEILGLHIREAHRIEKAETIRRMTGGVYHSLNNLFTTLLGRSSLLLDAAKRAASMPVQFTSTLEMMNRTLSRGADILKRLRGLMRETAEEPVTRIDLRALVADVVALTEPLLREGETRSASMELRLSLDEVPSVVGRPSELLEVLLNLVVNAIEAMPEGGALSIETTVEDTEVLLRVRDTGVGIPDAVKPKLFTPFFTTKSGGTGLGLNVSREIIRGHGGELTVESHEGNGTCITVRFPTAKPLPADLAGWRVLVADDDGLSRMVVVELLAAIGCRSEGVPGGLAALAAVEMASYDLVLFDVFMPDMPGWEAARVVRSRDRAPLVGLFTGWDIGPDDPMLRDSGADLFLQKPVRLPELLQAVQHAVEKRRAQPA
jgi:two-component system cell cycle sensor histidine kinase/response regulator CckA